VTATADGSGRLKWAWPHNSSGVVVQVGGGGFVKFSVGKQLRNKKKIKKNTQL